MLPVIVYIHLFPAMASLHWEVYSPIGRFVPPLEVLFKIESKKLHLQGLLEDHWGQWGEGKGDRGYSQPYTASTTPCPLPGSSGAGEC